MLSIIPSSLPSTNGKPKVIVETITFNNDQDINFTDNQITIFVGPNNVGKSVVLKELNSTIKKDSPETIIIKKIKIKKYGSIDEFTNFITNTTKPNSSTGYRNLPGGATLYGDINQLRVKWFNVNEQSLGEVHSLFCNIITTTGRLELSQAPDSINLQKDVPRHPVHYLQLNDELEVSFNKYFRQAFGTDLIVNWGAGRTVPMHVGTAPTISTGKGVVSTEYLTELFELPELSDQGDGMRSFCGVLLSLYTAPQNILIIDEPEAFLHPPQAYLLGQMIAQNIPQDKQIFLSTHSEDLLKGIIEKYSHRVKIIRITREENTNFFAELDHNDINILWKDPLLKYSNILSGLFHKRVIACESDGDCRFFGAMVDVVSSDENQIKPDILFVHCGGKHRLINIVKALTKVGVNLSVVSDIDILNSESPLKPIYEGLGGDWETIKVRHARLTAEIAQKRPELEADDVINGIGKIFSALAKAEKVFPKEKVEEIRALIKRASPWAEVKDAGRNFIPRGQATQHFDFIVDECRKVGLYILKVGELEGFDKTIGRHGPGWVSEVLQKDLVNSPDLEEARQFANLLLSTNTGA